MSVLSKAWHWLRDGVAGLLHHPLHLIAVLACGVAGAAVAIPPADVAFDYVWRDPTFCDDCHIHDYADQAFFRSVHAGLTTCHDCHRVPIMHYPRNLVGVLTFDRTQKLEHAPHVEEVICSSCHVEADHVELTGPMTEAVRESVVKIDKSPLHRVHLDAHTANPGVGRGGDDPETAAASPHGEVTSHGAQGDDPIDCMACHGGTFNRAHRFEASRDNCVACHSGLAQAAGRLEQLQCQECHFHGFVGQ